MEEQNIIPLTHCFLDTNVFLHFQRFDTVDWPKVLGVQQVCLMLTTTVMEELNHYKDDSKNPGRQKRAREILSRLDDVITGSHCRCSDFAGPECEASGNSRRAGR